LLDACPELFSSQRKAKIFLDKHPKIRQRKPSKQRLEVHAGDWFRYFASRANRAEPSDEQIAAYLDGIEQRKGQHRAK
jgi:hypothetical protein